MKGLHLATFTRELLARLGKGGLTKEEIKRILKAVSADTPKKFETFKDEDKGELYLVCTGENIAGFISWIVDRYFPCEEGKERGKALIQSNLVEKLLSKMEEKELEIKELVSKVATLEGQIVNSEKELKRKGEELHRLKEELDTVKKEKELLENELRKIENELRERKIKEKLLEEFGEKLTEEEIK